MKDEQLESMCRSLFDILQRSLRIREAETEREKKESVSNPETKRGRGKEDVKKEGRTRKERRKNRRIHM